MNTPVTGAPRLLLRIEGFAVLTAAVVGYHHIGASWWLFALLFLTPDIALATYAAGPRVGAIGYNVVHSYVTPALLAAVAYVADETRAWPMCLIWCAHIGMDRAFGLGLKFTSGFRDTHLGSVGRVARTA